MGDDKGPGQHAGSGAAKEVLAGMSRLTHRRPEWMHRPRVHSPWPGAIRRPGPALDAYFFMVDSAFTGALTSTVSRLPSLPSITRVRFTVEPSVKGCFRSIIIT